MARNRFNLFWRWLSPGQKTTRRAKTPAQSPNLKLLELEQRIAPAFLGGFSVASADINGDSLPELITATGPGSGPHIQVFDGATGNLVRSFYAFDKSFAGGITVAAGDLNGDNRAEIIVGAGEGGHSHVVAFDGATGEVVKSFYAFDKGFASGITVAAGDLNGDNRAEIIVGAGEGGHSHVVAFDGATGEVVKSFYAFDKGFASGITVAAGDLNGDNRAEIIVGAGEGGHSHVVAFNAITGNVLKSYYAFDKGFASGITVAAGDLNGDNRAEIIVGAGEGGRSHLVAFDGTTDAVVKSFHAFPKDLSSPNTMAVADLNGDNCGEILVGSGPGQSARFRYFDGKTGKLIGGFTPYGANQGELGGFWARKNTAPTWIENGVFTVPQTGQAQTTMRMRTTMRETDYTNESGFYRVDAADGRVGNLMPDDPGYAAAALAPDRSQPLRPDGTLEFNAEPGVFYAFYLIQNGTFADWSRTNSGNDLDKLPLAFFSVGDLPDGFPHMQSIPGWGRFGWEDLTRGGDQDFNDTIGEIQVEEAPAQFDPELRGWTIGERGGSAGKRGLVVSENGQAVFREGDSFLTTLSRSFVAPGGSSTLEFTYEGLGFDTSSPGFVNDAFEVALVDSAGNPLVPVFAQGRDAFFNVTDGNVFATGSATTVEGQRVRVDLSSVPSGTAATLVFRLIGNDIDLESSVTLASVELPSGSAAEAPVKFFVVNANSQTTFRYGEEGLGGGHFVDPSLSSPSGVASNPAGDKVWVVDSASHQVRVYGPTGGQLGAWVPSDAVTPTGVTVDNGTLWLVDRALGKVLRYAGGAVMTEGTAASTSSFALDPANSSPSDLVTDGATVWVTDDSLAEVFVYDVAGGLLGHWKLDGDNAKPSGITRNPAGGTDLWVLDRAAQRVFQYGNGSSLRTGQHGADGTFDLTPGNTSPEGIADPPVTDPNDPRDWQGAKVNTFAKLYFGDDRQQTRQMIINEKLLDDGLFDVLKVYPAKLISGPDSFGPYGCQEQTDNSGTGSFNFVFRPDSPEDTFNYVDNLGGASKAEVGGTVFELPFPSAKAAVFNNVDHPPLPEEAIESTVYLSNDNINWTQAVVQKVWLEGWQANLGIKWDGFVYAVGTSTNETFKYVSVIHGGPGALQADGDNELNAIVGLDENFEPTQPEEPSISVGSNGLTFQSETTTLLTGLTTAYLSRFVDGSRVPNRIVSVTVNGVPVDALDESGNFWSSVTVRPGENRFTCVATDAYGLTAETSITLTGENQASANLRMSQFADLSAGFKAEYSRTSYRQNGRELHADISVRNTSNYPVGVPLYVGVRNLSDPAVKVLNAAGQLPDGTPYYDFTGLVASGAKQLDPNGVTGTLSLSFANPNRDRFTYDLVFMGIPNRPPQFTSVPPLEATVSKAYTYPASATDPDGDALVYALVSGPDGMTVDAGTGVARWTPTAAQVGNFPVILRVIDGRSGTAEQIYTIACVASRANRPPVFVSLPAGAAQVGQAYRYDVDATDPDFDNLTYSLAAGAPASMTIDTTSGLINWTPGAAQLGDAEVSVLAVDGNGGTATQNYTICVRNDANRAPLIVSEPVTTAERAASQPSDPSPVNLKDWSVIQYNFNEQGPAQWIIDSADPTVATQRQNADASILLSDIVLENQSIEGTWSTTDGDDDYFGFVFGYQDPGHYYLFDWRKADQNDPLGFAERGMSVKLVSGNSPLTGNDLWPTSGNGDRVRSLFHNQISWNQEVSYRFKLEVYSGGFIVSVSQGETVLATIKIDDETYGPGKFGFYNYSQGMVNYSGFVTRLLNHNEYRYQVQAVDPDGGPLTYSLAQAPLGMTIQASTGLITWAPAEADEGKTYPVRVRVEDGLGGANEHSFPVTVSDTNESDPPPNYQLEKSYLVTANSPVRLPLPVTDPDGDPLTFQLVSGPQGLMVQPDLGVVGWQTKRADVGTHPVLVKATDTAGNVTLLPFTVTVAAPNTAPVFNSVAPAGPATVGLPVEYNPVAQDAEQAPSELRYSLASALPGMGIDPLSGRFTWTPLADQVGDRSIMIEVSDGIFTTSQTFILSVVAVSTNRAPVLSLASADSAAWLGRGYGARAVATDADGDPVRFSMVSGPTGMSLDPQTGVIRWTPSGVGSFPVQVRATDGRSGEAVQDFSLSVFATDRNHAPAIVSNPPSTGLHDALFSYDLAANDADGDAMLWQLVDGPQGASIDPYRGTLRWIPADDQTGPHSFTVKAVDPLLASGEQTFSVFVSCENQPATIVSKPVTTAYPNEAYVYGVRAVDPEGGSLVFSLESGPSGMEFAPGTSLLRWTPGASRIGSHNVTVRVTDNAGNPSTQTFTLEVLDGAPNRPPLITSRPILGATLGRVYTYQVSARDPDGDTVSYRLTESPEGMTIGVNGSLSFNPSTAGTVPVTVEVSDGKGGVSYQSFKLTAKANQAPSIQGSPDLNAAIGSTFRSLVRATDPENDSLSYALVLSPTGMTIDPQGRISWPVAGVPRSERVVVSVTDGNSPPITDEFIVTVIADIRAPSVQVMLSTNQINLGGEVRVTVFATDNVGVASVSLTADGVAVPLDSKNSAVFPASLAGRVTFAATASDLAGNTATATTDLRVIDPSQASDVRTNITRIDLLKAPGQYESFAIDDNAVPPDLSYLSTVFGTITSTGQPLHHWRLLLARSSDVDLYNPNPDSPVWREIGGGTTIPADGKLGVFDPTTLANDRYVLALAAYDVTGAGYMKPAEVNVVGQAKLGDFRLEFTDLSLPLNGIPVQITRVYDTKDSSTSGDFGYGWTMGIRDARISETVPAGATLVPDKSKVYLTAPDGTRVGFTYKEKLINAFPFGWGALWEPYFVADAGHNYKLQTPSDPQSSRGGIIGALGGEGINPSHYRLTTPEGMVYDYDQNDGLKKITDTTGNTVTFTANAITHSGGRSIGLERDGHGRITAVRLPNGEVTLRYRYDSRGDLVEVRQITELAPVEKALVTTLSYKPNRPHYLDESIDANGNRALKLEYDPATGRLKGVTDANGNTSTQEFDPANFTETVRDARGNPTRITYNERGNITRTVQPIKSSEIVNQYFYEDPANPDKETKVINPRGFATTRTFDARGNMLNETTAEGSRSFTYNEMNKVTKAVDLLGGATVYQYSSTGKVETVTNPLGDTATVSYDSQGRVQLFANFDGVTTQYADYCSCGSPLTTINPDGSIRKIKTNQFSQVIQETDELGNIFINQYDNSGRLIGKTDADGKTVAYTYEGNNLAKEIDDLGNAKLYTYGANGKVKTIQDAEGGITRFTYDKNSNLETLTDAVGNVTTYLYDEANRVVEERDPLGNSRYFQYDAAGNVAESTDRNGRKRTFEYDASNRLLAEHWWQNGVILQSITQTYDAAGNLLSAINPEAQLTYTYDAANRMTTATTFYPGLNNPSVTLSYTYDAVGNVLQIRDNLGVQVASTYDYRGNLVTRSMSGTGVGDGAGVRFTYRANGERATLQRFENAGLTVSAGKTEYTYFRNGLVKTIDHLMASGTAIASYTYAYDALNRVETETHHDDTYRYGYDKTSQLTQMIKNGKLTETFSYDANGNRLVATGLTPGNYTVIPGNRYSSDGKYIYTHDQEGSLKSKTKIGDGENTVYTWDFRNRLATVELRSGRGVLLKKVEYIYDAQDQRITEIVDGTKTLITSFDRDNSWIDYNPTSSAPSNRYLFSNKLDEIIASNSDVKEQTWHFPDNLGSIRDILAQKATQYETIGYSSYGNALIKSGDEIIDRYLFTGREKGPDSNLWNYRSRFYDSATGKFLSQDKIGFLGKDFNLSRYVQNSPSNFVDPFGNMAMTEYLGIISNPLNRGSMALIGFAHGFSFFTFNYLAEFLNSGNCKLALDLANEKAHSMHKELTRFGAGAGRKGLSLIGNFASGVGTSDFESYGVSSKIIKGLKVIYPELKEPKGGFIEGNKFAYSYFSSSCND